MIKRIVLIFLLVLAMSCNNSSKPIIYNEFIPTDKSELTGEVINSSFPFVYPSEILLYDSLIIVASPISTEYIFHVFEKSSGKHLVDFGTKGRGGGEVILARSPSINPESKTLTVFDASSKKIVSYDLEKILAGESSYSSEKKIIFSQGAFFLEDIRQIGTSLLVRGRGDMRFGVIGSNEDFTAVSDIFPALVKDSEENQSIWSYEVKWKISPNGKKMVTGTYIGALLEIVNITDDLSLHNNTLLALSAPIYQNVAGTKPKWITHTEETIFGFEDICVTDKCIYALQSNPNFTEDANDSVNLHVIDWNGNVKKTYCFDHWVYSLVADETENSFYGLAQREDEYVLMRYEHH